MEAALPETEAERLAALRACRILDTDAEDFYDSLTRVAALACGTPLAAVSLVDLDRQWFKSALGLDVRETPRDVAFCAHTILQPDVMAVPDAALDPRFADNPLVTGSPHIRFYAGAPLVTEDGHALGDLCVADRAPRRIAPEQEDALRTLARLVVRQIERGRWAHARADQAAPDEAVKLLAREREVTAALQRSLLQMPPAGTFAGLDVASYIASATDGLDVGGDYLDAFPLAGKKVALVVGDVTGKGLESAARTAEAKYVLRAYLSESERPADALKRLNDYLWAASGRDAALRGMEATVSFICLALAVVDTASGKAWVASAGAEQPLIVRASGAAEAVPVAGLPLRVQPAVEYDERHLSLAAGDLLVMATDGVTEARGHKLLGYEGLTELAVQAHPHPSANQVARMIGDGARNFASGQLRDDIAVLVARLRQPEA